MKWYFGIVTYQKEMSISNCTYLLRASSKHESVGMALSMRPGNLPITDGWHVAGEVCMTEINEPTAKQIAVDYGFSK